MGMGSGVGGGGVGASETAGVGAINAALAVEAASEKREDGA